MPTLVWDGEELAQSTAIARFEVFEVRKPLKCLKEINLIFELPLPGLLPEELAWQARMILRWQKLTWYSPPQTKSSHPFSWKLPDFDDRDKPLLEDTKN